MKRFAAIPAVLLLLASCSTTAVRLYEYRDADPDTPRSAAYSRLEEAVVLVNEFLQDPHYGVLYPGEGTTFSLGHSDILIRYPGETTEGMRIDRTSLVDLRTLGGADSATADYGFLSAPIGVPEEEKNTAVDVEFFQLAAQDMAAVLLRQGAIMREIRARGSFNFWMNRTLLGIWPGNWGDNPVTSRAYQVEDAFRQWFDETRGPGPEDPLAPAWETPSG